MTQAEPEPSPPRLRGDYRPQARRRFSEQLEQLGLGTWELALLGFSLGVSLVASLILLRAPGAPRCQGVFWPLASVSDRLYCAQAAAATHTVDGLGEAMTLIDGLPAKTPLHDLFTQYLQDWSDQILRLAATRVDQGDLEGGIAAVQKIPPDSPTHAKALAQVKAWQALWAQGEQVLNQSQAALNQGLWAKALTLAGGLENLDNQYWATTRYNQLTQTIEAARTDANHLRQARELAGRGDVADLLAAINLVQGISPTSALHDQAQVVVNQLGEQMLTLAQQSLDRHNLPVATAIALQIPASAGMAQQVEDFLYLAQAQAQAWPTTIPALEQAIATATALPQDRPLYPRAQSLIHGWQQEIAALPILAQARSLAAPGGLDNLTQAIATADQIGSDNPLYPQAQAQIQGWTLQIQRIQDQPILNQAQAQAAAGNLNAAIAIAGRIAAGRALYPQAQAQIKVWQETIQAQQIISSASNLAAPGTLDGLTQAVQLLKQVPTGTPLGSQATNLINQFSNSILNLAISVAPNNPQAAITAAAQIPPQADAYSRAQQYIKTWGQASPAPSVPPSP